MYYVVADWFYYNGCDEDEHYGFDILSVCTDEESAKKELANQYMKHCNKYNSFTNFRVYMKDTDDKTPVNFEKQIAKFGISGGKVYNIEESNRRLEKFLNWKNPMDKYRRGGW